MNHQQAWFGLVAFAFFFSFFQIVGRLQKRLGEISGVTSVPYLGKGKEGGNWLAVVSKNTRSCAAVFVTPNNTALAVCLFVLWGFWCVYVSITVSVTCLLRSGVQSSSSSSSSATTTTTKRHGFRRPANRCVCMSVVTT